MTDKMEGVKVGLAEIIRMHGHVLDARSMLAGIKQELTNAKRQLSECEEALSDTIRAAEQGQVTLFPDGMAIARFPGGGTAVTARPERKGVE